MLTVSFETREKESPVVVKVFVQMEWLRSRCRELQETAVGKVTAVQIRSDGHREMGLTQLSRVVSCVEELAFAQVFKKEMNERTRPALQVVRPETAREALLVE